MRMKSMEIIYSDHVSETQQYSKSSEESDKMASTTAG